MTHGSRQTRASERGRVAVQDAGWPGSGCWDASVQGAGALTVQSAGH
jgi:hypothetical protein